MVNWLFLIFIGFLPSIFWLAVYLSQDKKPEAKKTIIQTYILGSLFVIPAILIEIGTSKALESLIEPGSIIYLISFFFIVVAATEEYMKYLAAKVYAFGEDFFDEPTDAVIYLVTSALGFAGIENVIYMFSFINDSGVFSAVSSNVMRGLLPIFLHTISSGILGYFLAMSFFDVKKRRFYKLIGFSFAIISHGIFNILVSISQDKSDPIILLYIFLALLLLLAVLINRIKYLEKMKSVCKINIRLIKK